MTALHRIHQSAAPGGIPLTIEGVGKAFGQREVLRDIDLQIPAGQFVAVVGRSGCGKSTLLRLLAGLEQPSRGSLGADTGSLGTARDATRLMFQDARLLPWKRVIDNVGLGLSGDWRPQAADALAAVGLAERANDWPAALSGGQKQRVALARALMNDPEIVLADEPTGNLDSKTGDLVLQYLFDLTKERGHTLVVVTHNDAVARRCDRQLMLKDGSLV